VQSPPPDFGFLAFLPLLLMTLPIAIGAGWLAPKFGGRRWLWIVLGLIPIVNIVVIYILPFRVCGVMLDRLAAIEARLGTK